MSDPDFKTRRAAFIVGGCLVICAWIVIIKVMIDLYSAWSAGAGV